LRLLRIAVVGAVLCLGMGAPAAGRDAGCGTEGFGSLTYLTGFPPEAPASDPFYYSLEEAADAGFSVKVEGDACGSPAEADYSVSEVDASNSAADGVDFVADGGIVSWNDTLVDRQTRVPVELLADGASEGAEWARVRLTEVRGAYLGFPSFASFYIVDDDGLQRFAFGRPAYTVDELTGDVNLPVFRLGASATGSATVGIQPGPGTTAQGADFSLETPSLTFGDGARVRNVRVSIANDGASEGNENIELAFASGVSSASPATSTITIAGSLETDEPWSSIHHPNHRWKYPYGHFKIREVHFFTKDRGGEEGTGVVRTEMSLRRRMKGGGCGWWNGDRFTNGSCSSGPRNWQRAKAFEPGYFYYYSLKRIGPSVGTNVENYTMWSRTVDRAGNVESSFKAGRNANTFEVCRRSPRCSKPEPLR
jgi:hypothetical protein